MKKKLLSFMLIAAMVLGMSTTAMAEDVADATGWVSEARTEALTLNKIYNVTGSTDETLFPSETLGFTVEADAANPDTPEITVNNLDVKGNTDQEIKINLPVYDTVGVYKYTITESDGASQGVVYTDAAIAVTVLVSYDHANKELVSEIVLSTTDEDGKVDTFTNEYNVGHLTVKKTISGNLASDTTYFEMTVTLTSSAKVASDITVSGGSNNSNPTVINVEAWTGDATTGYTATETFYLKADETLTFANIPDGVTYEVVEATRHGVGEDGFDANSAVDTDYTVTYTNKAGEIETNETNDAIVNNDKATTVVTGLIINNMPYIVMLALVCGAVVLFVMNRRRRMEF